MTTKYDPYENAVAERINGILKGEFLISNRRMLNEDVIQVISDSIKTYNQLRPHMSNEYLTPEQGHSDMRLKCKHPEERILAKRCIIY